MRKVITMDSLALTYSIIVASVIILIIVANTEYYSKKERAKRKCLKNTKFHPHYHIECPDCGGACIDDWGDCPTCQGIGFIEIDEG